MSSLVLKDLNITAENIQQYDRRIPRYTSYPTAPYWTEEFTARDFREHLDRHSDATKDLSLYVHIPFCKKRCLFCGCNVIVARKKGVADEYLDQLEKEIDLLASLYKGKGRVVQLHLGGGTPNYLTHEQMARLLAMLRGRFDFHPDGERSIEVDPRVASPEDIALFHHEHGFKRISYGTQDFNPETQEAIGRTQTLEVTFENVEAARKAGFESINIDIIYGLPKQTIDTWRETLGGLLKLQPDRIAMYNFAFLPSKLPHQRVLEERDMPAPADKLAMFMESYNTLTDSGYEFIGMDHYALANDSLAQAQKNGTLRRNFMGYTTLRGTDLLGIGVSSISDFQDAFIQNVKKLTEYRSAIDSNELPVERGMVLSEDDKLRRYIIEELMCNEVLHIDASPTGDPVAIRSIVEESRAKLQPLMDDGLVEFGSGTIRVTRKGRIFLRNIAVVFDAYMDREGAVKPMFSRAV